MEYHAATHIHVDVVLYDPQDKDSIVVHCIYTSEARLTVYTNDPLGHCGLAMPRRWTKKEYILMHNPNCSQSFACELIVDGKITAKLHQQTNSQIV